MNSDEVKYLGQLVDTKILALERFLVTRMEAQDRALQLQAAEYERRLEHLNGEAERIRQREITYLPRELYERIDAQRCEDIKALESYRDTQLGRQTILSAIVAAVVSVTVALAWKMLV